MTKLRLLNGPCDPREIEMVVTTDAVKVSVRQMPYDVRDIYTVTERFIEQDDVILATGEYSHTEGTRVKVNSYRKALARLGARRAFLVKRTAPTVH